MSKKMANKIVAAILSLGAVMNSGSTSSAAEKTDKKSEIQNSERSVMPDYLRSGLGVLKENLSFKDLLYFLGMMKIYSSTRGNRGAIDISSAVKYLDGEWLKNYIPYRSVGYIEFYGAEDVLFNFIRSSKDHRLVNAVRNRLVVAQVTRINNLLSACEEKVNNETSNTNKNSINKNPENFLVFKNNEEDEKLKTFDEAFKSVPPCLKTVELELELNYSPIGDDSLVDRYACGCMAGSLLDDLKYLFKFTDEEIVDCLLSNMNLQTCIQKLKCLAYADNFGPERITPYVMNNPKMWSSYATRIKKLCNMLEHKSVLGKPPSKEVKEVKEVKEGEEGGGK